MEKTAIRMLADKILTSRSTVFFGGAGVSTESGVKDYRSKDGLYTTVKEYGVSPETILSRSFFKEHPDVFYEFYHTFFLQSDARPNPAHFALAVLEARGLLDAVITQNIDGLHQAAGSRNVLELHGTASRFFCDRCHAPFSAGAVKALGGKVPHCKTCGGIVRPAIVLYEEGLDEAVVGRAIDAIAHAELLIIGGTSLVVYPAAGFLSYFRGAATVLINRDPTPYDRRADLILRDPIGQVFAAVMKELG